MCLGMEQTSPSPRALTSFAAVSIQGVGAGAGSRCHQPGRPSPPFGLLQPSAPCLPLPPSPLERLGLSGLPSLAGASVGRADRSPPIQQQGPRGWRGIKLPRRWHAGGQTKPVVVRVGPATLPCASVPSTLPTVLESEGPLLR